MSSFYNEYNMEEELKNMGFTDKQVEIGMRCSSIQDAVDFILRHDFSDSQNEEGDTSADNEAPAAQLDKRVTFQEEEEDDEDDEDDQIRIVNNNRSAIPDLYEVEYDTNMNHSGGHSASRSHLINYDNDNYDEELNMALEQSMRNIAEKQEIRKENEFVGLLKVDAASHFNTLVHLYFMYIPIRHLILSLHVPQNVGSNDPRYFAKEIQKLFAQMLLSKRKMISPSTALHAFLNTGKVMLSAHNPPEFSRNFLYELSNSICATIVHPDFNNAIRRNQQTSQEDHSSSTESDPLQEDSPSSLNNSRNTDNTSHDIIGDKAIAILTDFEEHQLDVVRAYFLAEYMVPILAFDGSTYRLLKSNDLYTTTTVETDIRHQDLEEFIGYWRNASTEYQYRYNTAHQIVLYQQLPIILSFTLNRYSLRQHSFKLNDTFHFPMQTLYMDRALRSKLEDTLKHRRDIAQFSSERDTLIRKENRLLHYRDNVPALSLLQGTLHYLQISGSQKYENEISLLERQILALQEKLDHYNSRIRELEHGVANIWNDMRTLGYELFAVIVADGTTIHNLDHYVFIKDFTTRAWMKFDNHAVYPVSEEHVMAVSYGGPSEECAAELIYIQQEELLQFTQPSLEFYDDLIPLSLRNEIERDNQLYETQIRERANDNNNINNYSESRNNNINNNFNYNDENDGERNAVRVCRPNIHNALVPYIPRDESDYIYRAPIIPPDVGVSDQDEIPRSKAETNFTQMVESELNVCLMSLMDRVITHQPCLSSFKNYLLTMELSELLEYEICDEIHRLLFQKPFTESPASLRHNFDLSVHTLDLQRKSAYTDYKRQLTALYYFVSGMEHIKYRNFVEAGSELYQALEVCCEFRFSRKMEVKRHFKYALLQLCVTAKAEIIRGPEYEAVGVAQAKSAIALSKRDRVSSSLAMTVQSFWGDFVADIGDDNLSPCLRDLKFYVDSIRRMDFSHPVYPPAVNVKDTDELWNRYLELVEDDYGEMSSDTE